MKSVDEVCYFLRKLRVAVLLNTFSEKTEIQWNFCSDVKRGQNLQAEAEANFWRSRPRPRLKIIMKKYQMMINNIRLKIIAGKINKILKFYTIFARKMPPMT